jgi:hypothetical protein
MQYENSTVGLANFTSTVASPSLAYGTRMYRDSGVTSQPDMHHASSESLTAGIHSYPGGVVASLNEK